MKKNKTGGRGRAEGTRGGLVVSKRVARTGGPR